MYLLSTNLPVADPSFVIDDGAAHSVIDGSSAVYSVLQWLVSAFRQIVSFFDSVIIYKNTSLLDFHIAVAVFGILFAVLFVSVRSSVGNSIDTVDSRRREDARRERGWAFAKSKRKRLI